MEAEMMLCSFGFSELESTLYCELLRQAPATGYRLAQRIGKAPANVYQALKAMEQKGAVLASNSNDPQTYAPVPPGELFVALKRAFDRQHDESLRALSAVYQPVQAENFLTLRSVQQVFDRARTMLAEAREIVLFDFFPVIFDLFEADIEAARQRGVCVAGIAYREKDAGPFVPYSPDAAEVVSGRWPGLGVLLVVDGEQQLIAHISSDQQAVLNGIWSNSVFQSCIFHSAVASDIRLLALCNDPSDPLAVLSPRRTVPPGLRQMFNREDTATGESGNRMTPLPRPRARTKAKAKPRAKEAAAT